MPPIVEQVNNLVDEGAGVRAGRHRVTSTRTRRLRDLNEDYDLTAKLQEEAGKLAGRVGDVAGLLGDIGLGLVNSIFAGVTILTLSIFMIGGGPRWRDAFLRNQPAERGRIRCGACSSRSRRDRQLRPGRAATGDRSPAVASFIMLAILGIPYAAALSVIVFALDLIPLIGATLGAVLVGIVILFAGDFPIDLIIWVDLLDRLPAGREQRDPAAHPVARGRARAVPRRGLGAVRVDAVRRSSARCWPCPVAASLQIAAREYWAFRRGRVRRFARAGVASPSRGWLSTTT